MNSKGPLTLKHVPACVIHNLILMKERSELCTCATATLQQWASSLDNLRVSGSFAETFLTLVVFNLKVVHRRTDGRLADFLNNNIHIIAFSFRTIWLAYVCPIFEIKKPRSTRC